MINCSYKESYATLYQVRSPGGKFVNNLSELTSILTSELTLLSRNELKLYRDILLIGFCYFEHFFGRIVEHSRDEYARQLRYAYVKRVH